MQAYLPLAFAFAGAAFFAAGADFFAGAAFFAATAGFFAGAAFLAAGAAFFAGAAAFAATAAGFFAAGFFAAALGLLLTTLFAMIRFSCSQPRSESHNSQTARAV
jgi:hypothetical protein